VADFEPPPNQLQPDNIDAMTRIRTARAATAARPCACQSPFILQAIPVPVVLLAARRYVAESKQSSAKRIIEEADMADQQPPDMKLPDPVELSRAMARIAEQSQRLVADFLERQASGEGVEPVSPGMSDPLNIGRAFLEMTTRMMTNPAKLVE